jgi:hypothetical protein
MDTLRTNRGGTLLSPFTVKKAVVSIAAENHIIFDSWIECKEDPADYMKDHGFIRKSIIDAFGNGHVGVWIEKSIIVEGKIINQTIDHYATACQIIGDFILRGFECEIQHVDGPDGVVKLPGSKTLSIEYERPGTHTATQIFDKHQTNLQKYDVCLVVTTSQNYAEVQDAIGCLDVVARGEKLRAKIDEKISNIKVEKFQHSEV